MSERLEDLVRIAPAVWPGRPLPVQPGDLSQFLPEGMGLQSPLPVSPWDQVSDLPRRTGYYAFEPRVAHPLKGAPRTTGAGGVVYFDSGHDTEDVATLLRLMEVWAGMTEYAVFAASSENPDDDGFVIQLRIMSAMTLRGLFGANTDGDNAGFIHQPHSMGDMVMRFIEQQTAYWGTGFSAGLSGAMGGDGDWAREQLAFGFMVENGYHSVYRLWSRAWLVTK